MYRPTKFRRLFLEIVVTISEVVGVSATSYRLDRLSSYVSYIKHYVIIYIYILGVHEHSEPFRGTAMK